MSSRRLLNRSFSADGGSNIHRTSDRLAGNGSNSYSYLDTVRTESRSTLYCVLAQLTELTQPMFETTLKSRAVSETTNVKFSCVVSGYPAPEVTWYKDDVQLDKYCSLPKYKIIHEGKTHTLHIYDCSLEDAAIYQVSARNSQGIVSCSGILEVGTMNEYKIHQNYFAKLKQKAKRRHRGQEEIRHPDKENVPDAMDAVWEGSPERAQRKCRSPTDASIPHIDAASPEQPEELRNHKETAVAANPLDGFHPEPSTTVKAVSNDDTFNNGQAIVDHNMINVVNFASNRMPDEDLFAKKKIKISAEGGERGGEDRQADREQERKKETQRGKDRNLSKANLSPLPSEVQMEVDSNVIQPKATSELRSTVKEVKTKLRKNEFLEMAERNRNMSATKPPAPQKQPLVKISTATKTDTARRPTDLKRSTKVKRENPLPAVPSQSPSHLTDVSPHDRAVKKSLTKKNQMAIERPGDPLSGEPGRGHAEQVGSRTFFVSRECTEAPEGLNSGDTKEQALFESVMIPPQIGGRITLIMDTSERNVCVPYTTSMATKDQIPDHMETAICDNSTTHHIETCTDLKQQPSNGVIEDNMGKPSSYKLHITNHKHRQNMEQHPIRSNKSSTHPGTECHQKGQEISLLGENTPLRHSSQTQQQDQVTSAMNSSQVDAKEQDQEHRNRMTEEHCIGNKSGIPAADSLKKSQQHEVDISVTEIGSNKTVCVNAKTETEHLIPGISDAYQAIGTDSQLHHPSNTLNSETLQLQTQELSALSSQSAQATDIQECKKISESTIPAVDENEKGTPGKNSWEYERKSLVENDFAKTGSEVCFPPASPAPAGKPPKPETSASSKILSSCLETVIPLIYVTDVDSTQENDGTDTATHESPDFKNRNKSAESSLADISVTTNEQNNNILNQIGFKQTDTVLADSAALTDKTLPGVVSAPLNLQPSEVNRACQALEKSVKVNESLTVPSSQSADAAGSGPVTDNNTPRTAEGSTTTKLSGTAETTNITSLLMQNFTQLNLVRECPESSQESNLLLTEKHPSPPSAGSVYLIQDLKNAALNLEDMSDAAVVLQNTVPQPGRNLRTEDTLAVPQKHALRVSQENISSQAKEEETIVQMAGDTEVKEGAPHGDNLPPQESLSSLPAQTPPERISSELIYQDVLLALPNHDQELVQGSAQLKAPQVIRKIQTEICDTSGNVKLWCQFFNVRSDSILRWYKDDVEMTEMKSSAGDESQVSLAVVQMSERDCGLYRCTITNEYGTDFTDYLLTSESPSSLVLREDSSEVGEEIEMTPLLFGKGLSSAGYWGVTFFGRILTEEAQVGTGCEHKTSRAKVIYGLDPVFDMGNSCLIKVQSPIAYRGREEINLAERNIQITKQACKIQNLAREYCKIFAAQTRMIENFGSELEFLPLYFIYRPARNIPYATVEVELKGVYLHYCGLDKAGSLVVKERSEVAQKCSSFQHWIYQHTNGNLLFTRLEGVDTIMTNIGVSVKSEGYQGFPCRANPLVFEKFQSQHQCNYFCGLLGLRPLKVTEKLRAAVRPKASQSPQPPCRADNGQCPQTQRKACHNQRK
ncbi:alpha-protein kinase 3 isoform X2 [Electrophorus electricus]|uniref:alpha-protein kinase 3 isoform X2 n=1 Tax=Electrophorus electricus TaxID=8005 RepID=UPI0015D075ED|nr:alpha-protein kinase 3 isoform X2 [Electrophorus electricus]